MPREDSLLSVIVVICVAVLVAIGLLLADGLTAKAHVDDAVVLIVTYTPSSSAVGVVPKSDGGVGVVVVSSPSSGSMFVAVDGKVEEIKVELSEVESYDSGDQLKVCHFLGQIYKIDWGYKLCELEE